MAMQRHAVANHFAVEDVEGSEQSRRPVTSVVMSEGSTSPGLHRQSRLSSLKRLDLTLLVNAQHESLFRRIHIKPTTSRSLSTNRGSRLSLNVLVRVFRLRDSSTTRRPS